MSIHLTSKSPIGKTGKKRQMDVTPVKSGRRVLGDLKVNATFGSGTPSRAGKTATKSAGLFIDEDGENTLQLSPAKNVAAGRKRSIDEVVSDGSADEDRHRRRGVHGRGRDLESVSDGSSQASGELQGLPVSVDDAASNANRGIKAEEIVEDHQPTSSSATTTGSTYVGQQPDEDDAASASSTTVPGTPRFSDRITEALKLRLQLALYKAQTGQTNVPFDRLQILPQKKLSSLSSTSDRPALLPAPPGLTSRLSNSTRRFLKRQQVPLSPSSLSRSEAEGEEEEEFHNGAEECSSEDEDGSTIHGPSSSASGLPQLSSPPLSQIQNGGDEEEEGGDDDMYADDDDDEGDKRRSSSSSSEDGDGEQRVDEEEGEEKTMIPNPPSSVIRDRAATGLLRMKDMR